MSHSVHRDYHSYSLPSDRPVGDKYLVGNGGTLPLVVDHVWRIEPGKTFYLRMSADGWRPDCQEPKVWFGCAVWCTNEPKPEPLPHLDYLRGARVKSYYAGELVPMGDTAEKGYGFVAEKSQGIRVTAGHYTINFPPGVSRAEAIESIVGDLSSTARSALAASLQHNFFPAGTTTEHFWRGAPVKCGEFLSDVYSRDAADEDWTGTIHMRCGQVVSVRLERAGAPGGIISQQAVDITRPRSGSLSASVASAMGSPDGVDSRARDLTSILSPVGVNFNGRRFDLPPYPLGGFLQVHNDTPKPFMIEGGFGLYPGQKLAAVCLGSDCWQFVERLPDVPRIDVTAPTKLLSALVERPALKPLPGWLGRFGASCVGTRSAEQTAHVGPLMVASPAEEPEEPAPIKFREFL